MKNPSLCDGYGYRTVIFLQGCDLRCEGCQNKATWDIEKGTLFEILELAKILREKCKNKKLTISGGEPLLQADVLAELLEELKDFDLCLYTGHELNEVPENILKYLKYVKVGRYIEKLRTTTKPFVGSKNQQFMEVIHDGKTK
jgi:anaerobic ribonucleoside-triphosphate reductase activating protein